MENIIQKICLIKKISQKLRTWTIFLLILLILVAIVYEKIQLKRKENKYEMLWNSKKTILGEGGTVNFRDFTYQIFQRLWLGFCSYWIFHRALKLQPEIVFSIRMTVATFSIPLISCRNGFFQLSRGWKSSMISLVKLSLMNVLKGIFKSLRQNKYLLELSRSWSKSRNVPHHRLLISYID